MANMCRGSKFATFISTSTSANCLPAEEQQAEVQQAEVQNDDNEMDVVVENIPMQVVDDDPVNEAEVRALDGLLSLLGSAV